MLSNFHESGMAQSIKLATAKLSFVLTAALLATIACLYLMVMLVAHELAGGINIDTEKVPLPVAYLPEPVEERPPMRARATRSLPAEPPPVPEPGLPSAGAMMEVTAEQPVFGSLAEHIGPLDIQFQLAPLVPGVTPMAIVQPVYPLAAEMREIEGYVVVEFSIRENGTVANPIVVDSEPELIFDQAALNAVSRSRFKPREVGGSQIGVEKIKMKYAFTLDSLYDVPPIGQRK